MNRTRSITTNAPVYCMDARLERVTDTFWRSRENGVSNFSTVHQALSRLVVRALLPWSLRLEVSVWLARSVQLMMVLSAHGLSLSTSPLFLPVKQVEIPFLGDCTWQGARSKVTFYARLKKSSPG